jgi:hemin uptake protein HemP
MKFILALKKNYTVENSSNSKKGSERMRAVTAMTTSDDASGTGPATIPAEAGMIRRVAMAGNRIDSRELFAGTREITIAHGQGLYRLRLTAQNRLILTK